MRSPFAACASVALALGSAGCSHSYAPIASHTLTSPSEPARDVVWLTRDTSSVWRCVQTENGPICERAAMLRQ